MSQNSRDRHVPSPSTSGKPPSPSGSKAANPLKGKSYPFTTSSMEENADRLMDQVFGEVEQMLERGAQLQIASSDTPEPSPQRSNLLEFPQSEAFPPVNPADLPVSSSSLAVLPKLSPRQLTREEEPVPTDSEEDTDSILELVQDLQDQKTPPKEPRSFDQLLMVIAFAALMITSGIWVFVRYFLPASTTAANVPSAAEVLQAKQDAEFLNYVQRSMERIDRASKQAQASTAGAGEASVLPPLYVPVPPPPSIAVTPATVPSPTARISVAPLPPALTVAPSAAPAAPAAPTPAAVIPNIAPSPTHVLIGLLELGDRSAALFEINGAPQRIQVGEAIGSSGWALVSISGQEALVRRNGEVRSVYIGQQF